MLQVGGQARLSMPEYPLQHRVACACFFSHLILGDPHQQVLETRLQSKVLRAQTTGLNRNKLPRMGV